MFSLEDNIINCFCVKRLPVKAKDIILEDKCNGAMSQYGDMSHYIMATYHIIIWQHVTSEYSDNAQLISTATF